MTYLIVRRAKDGEPYCEELVSDDDLFDAVHGEEGELQSDVLYAIEVAEKGQTARFVTTDDLAVTVKETWQDAEDCEEEKRYWRDPRHYI